MSKRWSLALASVMITLSVAACGSPGQPGAPAGDNGTATASGGSGAPYKVGLVYSKSGPLASYGKQYRQGLTAGIDYATKGTGAVAGHTISITEQDDAGDPAKAKSMLAAELPPTLTSTPVGFAPPLALMAVETTTTSASTRRTR